MMICTVYLIVLTVFIGLTSTKPIDVKVINEKKLSEEISVDEAFQQAEAVLNRYFYLIKSDADQLVYAMFHIILNNPKSFPSVPRRALEIALKNFEDKLGQKNVDVLTKPILLSIKEKVPNKSETGSSSFHLTEKMKQTIEDALDKYFDEHINMSHV